MSELGEMVEFLWQQCACKEKNAYKNLDNLIGRGKTIDFVFNKDELHDYQPMIQLISSSLVQEDTEVNYQDLAYDNDGNKWIDNYLQLEKAVSLMNVIGSLEFVTSSKDWNVAESKNPKVRIKR